MKKFLILIICQIIICKINAQIHHTLPMEASEYYKNSIKNASLSESDFITKTAIALSQRQINFDSLCTAVKNVKSFQNYSPKDCRNISLLIVIRCALNADAELKRKVLQLQRQEQGSSAHSETEMLVQRKSDLAEIVATQLKNL